MKVILRKENVKERDLIQLGHTLGTVIWVGAFALTGTFRRRRHSKLLQEELLKANRREQYLAAMIDRYEIEVDEFDLIALRNL